MAVLMGLLINALTYVPMGETAQAEAEKKSSEEVVRIEIASENDEWATGYDSEGQSYVVNEEWVQVGDVIDVMVDEDGEINLFNRVDSSVTETFVVQSETQDGYLNAVSISEKTNAPYGYILDNKYDIGDVVEVTYSQDDILAERLIVGDELEELEDEVKMYSMATCTEGEVLVEDGSCVGEGFFE